MSSPAASACARRPAATTSRRRSSTASTTRCAVAREEIFGPVLTVIEFDDEDEALRDRQRLAVRAGGGRVDARRQPGPSASRRAPGRDGLGQHVRHSRHHRPVRRLQAVRLRPGQGAPRARRLHASSRRPGSTCPVTTTTCSRTSPATRRTSGPRARRRTRRPRGPASEAGCRCSGRGPSRGCATADRGRLGRRARIDPRGVAAGPRTRSGWTSSTPEARELLRDGRGARSSPGTQRVRFDPAMVLERDPDGARRVHAARPEPRAQPRRSAATGWPSARSPARRTSFDLDRGRRAGNRADYQDLIRLAQMLNAIHFFVGLSGRADRHPPVGPPPRRDLRRADADRQATSTPTASAASGTATRIEMARIARGVDEATLEREPSIFTVINSNSPLRLDTPMLPGHHRDLGAQPGHRA